MKKEFTRGRLCTISIETDDRRIDQMKHAPDLAEKALQAGADWWHTHILPLHFQHSAHGKYDYARRSHKYLLQRRKQGQPDLVCSGKMREEMKTKASLKTAGRGSNTVIELRMWARALNLIPNIADTNLDRYVTHQRRRGQRGSQKTRDYPNLKREIKAITDEEREALAQVICDELAKLFGPLETTNSRAIPIAA